MKIAGEFIVLTDEQGNEYKICSACDAGPCIISYIAVHETPNESNIITDEFCAKLPKSCILEDYQSEETAG